jgi:hypothetical protein
VFILEFKVFIGYGTKIKIKLKKPKIKGFIIFQFKENN